MSYHLASRSLRLIERAPDVGGFADCLRFSLDGDVSSQTMQSQMCKPASHSATVSTVGQCIGELLAVDMNPIGQLVRLAKSEQVFVQTWQAYNSLGNVVAAVPYSGASDTSARSVHQNHDKLLLGYQEVLPRVVRVNADYQTWRSRLLDSRVSSIAKVLGAGSLLTDLALFFESHPRAKVSDACIELGVHPRTLERRFIEVGVTPVMYKRVCMLTMASQSVLWSDKSFKDIAEKHGYADAAHMSRAFSAATGGLSPSTLRAIAAA